MLPALVQLDIIKDFTNKKQRGLLNMKTMTMIAAEAVEEKSIDRQYNAKRKERQTHLEVMGGVFPIQFAPVALGLSYRLR